MAVLAPSVKGLQTILNLCHHYCLEWDILLNAKKSMNMVFGKGAKPSFHTTINDTAIPWVDTWKYLGVTLKSGVRFDCCVKEKVASFYRSINSILRIEGQADELVKLRLLEAHCLPILTYAIETIHVCNREDRRQLRVAYNSIFRHLFSYSYNESVSTLQHALKRPTWEELCEKRRSNFLRKCATTDSTLIRVLI